MFYKYKVPHSDARYFYLLFIVYIYLGLHLVGYFNSNFE
jgi:hypothetical protein